MDHIILLCIFSRGFRAVVDASPHEVIQYCKCPQFSSMVEWLKCHAYDQHGLGLKPTHAILLCPWERHFTALSLLGGLDKQL